MLVVWRNYRIVFYRNKAILEKFKGKLKNGLYFIARRERGKIPPPLLI